MNGRRKAVIACAGFLAVITLLFPWSEVRYWYKDIPRYEAKKEELGITPVIALSQLYNHDPVTPAPQQATPTDVASLPELDLSTYKPPTVDDELDAIRKVNPKAANVLGDALHHEVRDINMWFFTSEYGYYKKLLWSYTFLQLAAITIASLCVFLILGNTTKSTSSEA